MKNFFSFFVLALLFFASIAPHNASATFSPPYTRDSLTGLTYDSLTTGTIVTAVQVGNLDDGDIYINLPFSFTYNGTSYNRITACTNGWIAMDSTTATNFTPNLFSNSTAVPINTVGGWFRDNNLNTGFNGMFKHGQVISGSDTAYVVEWRNVASAAGGGTSSTLQVNFQIWLYKTTNKIIVKYGPSLGAIVTSAAIGIKDDGAGALPHFLNAITNSSTSGTLATAWGGNGNGYRFNPGVFLANDVGITAISIPDPDPFDINKNVIPSATVKNFGTNNQLTPFNVTCKIEPGGYSSTVQDTVSAGLSNQVSFAVFLPSDDFTIYTITVYTSLASDQDHNNDTMRVNRNFPKSNSGFDPVCQYYFANSMAPLGNPPPQAQSRPRWCWKDTTGSKSLVVNNVNAGFAPFVGNLDDGYWKLSIKNILLALNQDTTDKRIKYCGVCYDSIFPGTNGVIGLTEAFGATSLTTFTIDPINAPKSALFPIWKDFRWDVFGTGAGTNRISVKAKDHQLIITYDRGAAFSDVTQWASFQVVVEIIKDCGVPNSNFRYTYADSLSGNTSGAYVSDYLASLPILLNNATPFFNHMVGYGAAAPNNLSIFRGYMSTANPFFGVNQVRVNRNIFHPTTGAGLALEYGVDPNKLNIHDGLLLCLSVALEGLQSNAQPRVLDTVWVELRDCQSPPYKIIQKVCLPLTDSVVVGSRTYGRVYIDLSWLKRGFPYYLKIRHRNSIASWSNSFTPVSAMGPGDTVDYDFTSGLGQIFGANGVLVNGNASFYGGDVNQDGTVDGADCADVDNDAFNFATGDYLVTDLNWDGVVDGSDAAICDNNAFNFVVEVAPPGALRIVDYEFVPSIDYKAPEVLILPDPYAVPKIDPNSVIKKDEETE